MGLICDIFIYLSTLLFFITDNLLVKQSIYITIYCLFLCSASGNSCEEPLLSNGIFLFLPEV